MTQRPDGYRVFESDAVFDALEALEAEATSARRVDGGPGARMAPRRPRAHGDRRRTDACRAPRAGPRGAVARALDRGARPSARVVPVIVLGEHDVRELLDMESCIEAMEDVLTSLARGELYQPLRSVARPPAADPASSGSCRPIAAGAAPAYALKEIVVTPDNPTRGLDAHHGRRPPARRSERRAARDHERFADHRDSHGSRVGRRDTRARATGAQSRRDPRRRRRRRKPTSTPCEPFSTTRRSASGQEGSKPRRSSPARIGATVAPSVDAALFGAEVVCTTTSASEPIVEKRWLARGRTSTPSARASRRRASSTTRRWPVHRFHRPPRVGAERGRRLRPRRRPKARSGPITSRPSSARCSPVCIPDVSTRTS